MTRQRLPRHGPPPPTVGADLTPALRARLLAAAAAARAAAHADADAGTSSRGVYVGTAGLALADLWAARRLGSASAAGRAAAVEAGLPPPAALAASALATARSAARLPAGEVAASPFPRSRSPRGRWRPREPLSPATFLEGPLGPFVVAGCAAAATAGSTFGPGDAGFEEWVAAVAAAAEAADAALPRGECEVLYGRAGVLSALTHAAAWVPGAAARLGRAAAGLAASILAEGGAAAAARRAATGEAWGLGPWTWHGTPYLGAAHGAAGILATLADAGRVFGGDGRTGAAGFWAEAVPPAVAAGLAGLVTHGVHPSGNLRSSVDSADDRLVHWCHGAPGLALLLATVPAAPGLPGADDVRRRCLGEACKVVWTRGWLTTKGVGLCHGWAGNGYALLAGSGGGASNAERVLAWAAALADGWPDAWRRADRPASLYEGAAGAFCFLVDVALWERDASPGTWAVGMPGFLVGG